jgi:hypothetical protein
MQMEGRLDVRVFGGFVWYAYPLRRGGDASLTPWEAAAGEWEVARMPLCQVGTEARLYGNYDRDGVIIATDDEKKPTVPPGWEIVPCSLPEGFGGVNEGTKIRHVHTTSETAEAVYSVFVALALPREQQGEAEGGGRP